MTTILILNLVFSTLVVFSVVGLLAWGIVRQNARTALAMARVRR